MFTESTRNHRYNLRTRGPLKFVNPSTASGEKCLSCYLPNFINNSSPQVLDKINTHSYEGFSFFIKRTKLNSYRIECTVPNSYICSNCPWINPVYILRFYFVLCYVIHGYPVQELLLWFDYLYPIFFSSCFSCVSFKLISLLKFANYVIYAWFGVQDPDTIIIFCMYNSVCKPVQTTKKSMGMLTIVSTIACRFCFIIRRSISKFEVSFKKLLVPWLRIHGQILMQVKTERLDNETAWYTCLLRWWPLCKWRICTLIRVSWRISNLDWLLLYFVQKCILSNKPFSSSSANYWLFQYSVYTYWCLSDV